MTLKFILKRDLIKESILEAIAENSPFDMAELHKVL